MFLESQRERKKETKKERTRDGEKEARLIQVRRKRRHAAEAGIREKQMTRSFEG